MWIDRVDVVTLSIPFRVPFVTGTRRWESRRLALLALHAGDAVGRGEFVAGEPGGLGGPSHDAAATVGPLSAFEGVHLADPVALEATLRRIDREPFVGPVMRSAAESAVVDLMAQARSVPVASLLGDRPSHQVAVNALIGEVDVVVAVAEARALVAAGWGCLKLKGGNEHPSVLVGRLTAVRDAVGPGVALRLDLNGSLDARTAASTLRALESIDLEYVEQPIPPTAGPEALARLRRASAIPIAADEAVRDLGAARALLDAEAVDVLVVKPARVGGLRQARSIVELALAGGVGVTISTLFETGIGITGALHLAATVPGDRAHGLGTASLLESDLLVRPLAIHRGRMAVPDRPGLGVELDVEAVGRYRVA